MKHGIDYIIEPEDYVLGVYTYGLSSFLPSYVSIDDLDDLKFYPEPYTLLIDEELDDICEYYFYKNYGVHYLNNLAWYQQPNAREFIRDIADRYRRNEIDTLTLYREPDFQEQLKETYHDLAVKNSLAEILSYYA